MELVIAALAGFGVGMATMTVLSFFILYITGFYE